MNEVKKTHSWTLDNGWIASVEITAYRGMENDVENINADGHIVVVNTRSIREDVEVIGYVNGEKVGNWLRKFATPINGVIYADIGQLGIKKENLDIILCLKEEAKKAVMQMSETDEEYQVAVMERASNRRLCEVRERMNAEWEKE